MKVRLAFAAGVLAMLGGCATYEYTGGYYRGNPEVQYRYPDNYGPYGPNAWGYYGWSSYPYPGGYNRPIHRPPPRRPPPDRNHGHEHRPPPTAQRPPPARPPAAKPPSSADHRPARRGRAALNERARSDRSSVSPRNSGKKRTKER